MSNTSKTLIVIAALVALLVIYQAAQPNGLEGAQTKFNEISAWFKKQF